MSIHGAILVPLYHLGTVHLFFQGSWALCLP